MVNAGRSSSSGENSRPKTIAAIPAFNEEKYIGTVVLQAKQYVDQVIVLDDGSDDRTSDVARLAGAEVVRHAANRGKGAALQSLMLEARNRGADILVFLDADAQHNPNEIPRLIKPITEGFDLAIGSRKAQSNKTPRYRRAGQKMLLYSANALSGTRLTDSESGFRAISRKAISEINLTEKGFAVETEMIVQASEKGLKIVEVPISNIYTQDGSTLNPWTHGFGVLGRIIVLISERRPLFFFGLVGMILTLLGLIIGLRVVDTSLQGHGLAVGTALIAAILVIIGLFSVFTAVILNSLKRLKT
jgi:glycosyltransferase involved in cell wall biosynthesis